MTTTAVVPGGVGAADRKVVMCLLLLCDCSFIVLKTRTLSTTTTAVFPGGVGAADREVVMCVSHLTL